MGFWWLGIGLAHALVPRAWPGVHAEQDAEFGRSGLHLRARPVSNVPASPAPPDVTVYGYWPYWGADPTDIPFDHLTHVAIFDVTLQADGSLGRISNWTDVAGEVVPLAHDQGVNVDLCVTAFDNAEMGAVLPSPTLRATAISNLVDLVEAYGADGVNVDFEGMSASLKDDFVTFIRELHAQVGELYIATPAVDWNGAYDYSALADASEGLFIMGYGYHWLGGDPGPVDPLYGGSPWSEYSLEWSVSDYIDHDAPPEKIILGLPLFGYLWPTVSEAVPGSATASGTAVVMSEAVAEAAVYGRRFDEVTQTPYVFPSSTSQLWYDDTDSVATRIRWALDEGLQGVGFWALGYEGNDPDFWEMVADQTAPPDGDGTNQPPVALAGQPFMAYPGDKVVLNGSGSYDPEGAALTWTWTQVGGRPVTLRNDDGPSPSFKPEQPGEYSFQLVVNDGELDSDPDVVDVIVVDPSAGTRYRPVEAGGCASAPARGRLGGWAVSLAAIGLWRRRRAATTALARREPGGWPGSAHRTARRGRA